MNIQRIASIARQAVAVIATVFGILTATVSTLHLPLPLSTILTATGPVIIALEHYLSDPTSGTGTPNPPTTTPIP